jgi:sacsin
MTTLTWLPQLERELRDTTMLDMLRSLPLLLQQDATLKPTLAALPFVTTGSGELQPPSRLYDPRSSELVALLESTTCFPVAPFDTPPVLAVLQALGLQAAVTRAVVLQSAHTVEDAADAPRGLTLLRYLEVHGSKLLTTEAASASGLEGMLGKVGMGGLLGMDEQHRRNEAATAAFVSDLQSIAWCPVLLQPPCVGLPWPTTSHAVAPPRLTRPKVREFTLAACGGIRQRGR